jgi:hypothetical protein
MDKYTKINENKQFLLRLCKKANKLIIYNNNFIDKFINYYKDFINLIEMTKIFEIYKWNKIKIDYNNIKKKITKDKKIYYDILKLYGKIITYFSEKENINIDSDIKSIYSKQELMIYNFINLKKIHKYMYQKYTSYIKNNNIIKITYKNDTIDILLKQLEDITNHFIILNKKLYILKQRKNKLLYEIKLLIIKQ